MSPSTFVLDNSVVLAWAFGEAHPGADGLLGTLATSEALVPAIWPLEFANGLVIGEGRKRLTEAEAVRARELVLALPIRVVAESPERVFSAILPLARTRGLSAYDASYLDLAMREGLPLATLDARLQDAARDCRVTLLLG